MSKLPKPAAQLLAPVLDMYLDSAIALTGCHAEDRGRASCELDVLVVGEGGQQTTSVQIGGALMDLVFIDEKSALKPPDPELAASMAHVKPVRDSSLLISTSSSAAAAMLADSCKRSTRGRLASSLKSLGRADEALGRDSAKEADFWLLAGSYDYAFALLYSRDIVPAPSHLLRQLKDLARGTARGFEAFSRGAALEKSSRISCASRLEGVSVLQDILRGRQVSDSSEGGSWTESRLDIVRGKAQELATRVEHAESYSFLGQEMVEAILHVASPPRGDPYSRATKKTADLGQVFAGKKQLLGDRLLKELGLVRDGPAVANALGVLRDQVSALAKK
ncbi:MAG: hypothetical protein OK404_02340 [Thaumarchaeota archaeon]|nr:hypothetical protein [Nitrososphaerota archaeon]